MGQFDVHPSALNTFSGILSGGSDSVDLDRAFSTTAVGYVDSYSSVPHDAGDLFAEIYLANRNVVTHLEGIYPQVATILRRSAAALDTSAQVYRDTDTQVSAKADALWPGVAPHALDEAPSSRARVVDPASLLSATPSKDAPIPDMVHWVIDKAGWFSIAGLALKICSLFGLDPVKDLTQAVVGDYDELAQAGHAAEALAAFERQAAETIVVGLQQMTSQWSGVAADAATAYFHELANALGTHAAELDTLGEKYELLVQTCAQIAELLSGALANAIDQVLICVAELAAAGCLASVPGINVIISVIGAYQVWKTQQAVALFLKYTGSVTTAVESFLGLTTFIASAFRDGDIDSTFPTAPYANGAQ
ncbi:hypothetical protein I601_1125 [Nocardioides dokdonensis FR1436]|uniref:Uncharacterized protein n=1 Tax=Nocardioides dokdonensis FR1436 TaxID=1300347 RepID=A0A1A9GGZ2_9ACTN|nr:hypothetical protein [Nocardioides dokdonensis]ANH37567.1 hypothetical protein I601_1125 [Nocardioides dokdonensis FR1436]